MKDAFGGILNIVLVAIFLVIISGILGLVVSYTKAFRMKNIIITTLEQYGATDGCLGKGTATGCRSRIENGAKNLGYSPSKNLQCNGMDKAYDLFCYKQVPSNSGITYRIVTQVDIDIPIINKIMGMEIFQVHGDTRVIKR